MAHYEAEIQPDGEGKRVIFPSPVAAHCVAINNEFVSHHLPHKRHTHTHCQMRTLQRFTKNVYALATRGGEEWAGAGAGGGGLVWPRLAASGRVRWRSGRVWPRSDQVLTGPAGSGRVLLVLAMSLPGQVGLAGSSPI